MRLTGNLLVCLSSAVWLWSNPASAQSSQDLFPADRAAMEQCLQSSVERGVRAHECIGFVQDACVEESGGSTYDMIECISREHAFWDALLNQSYAALREGEEAGGGTALRDLQRQWLKWREAHCEWEASAYEGGTFANVMANECFSLETARRAIDLSNAIQETDYRFRLGDPEKRRDGDGDQ